jgi:hypothetical protein
MSRVTEVMRRIFKRKSPEMYEALKKYSEEKGVKLEDAMNSAIALYLNSDEEGRSELEEAMKQIRETKTVSAGGMGSIDDFVKAIDAVGTLMSKVQETSHTLVKNSLLAEVKNQMELAKSIAGMGAEEGHGSIGGMLADNILANILGLRAPPPKPAKVATGKGKTIEVEE